MSIIKRAIKRIPIDFNSVAFRFAIFNCGFVALAVTAVLAFHMYVLNEQSREQEHWRANELASTLADFSARYVYELRISELQIALANVLESHTVERAMVVDSSGAVIADGHHELDAILDDQSGDVLIGRVLARHEAVMLERDGMLEVAYPISFSSTEVGAVRLSMSLDQMAARMDHARNTSYSLATISIAVGLLLTILWVRWFTRPLTDLTDRIKAVAKGDLQQAVAVRGGRELVELAHSFNAMTDALREKDERINRLAYYDALTDLPNRRWLEQALTELTDPGRHFRWCRPGRHSVVLMMIDLDRFKQVNDTLGHPIGDALLIEVADRLRHLVNHDDILPSEASVPPSMAARLGGDEMIALFAHQTIDDIKILAERAVIELSAPYVLEGHNVVIGASIGLAMWPRDATDRAGLMSAADIALYRAKSSGRGRVCIYNPKLDGAVPELPETAISSDLGPNPPSNGISSA